MNKRNRTDREPADEALTDAPRTVTEHGKAAVVPISAQHALETRVRPSLKELLLSDQARTDDLVPARPKIKLRTPVDFD